jgi:hypothetical protein
MPRSKSRGVYSIECVSGSGVLNGRFVLSEIFTGYDGGPNGTAEPRLRLSRPAPPSRLRVEAQPGRTAVVPDPYARCCGRGGAVRRLLIPIIGTGRKTTAPQQFRFERCLPDGNGVWLNVAGARPASP